MSAALILVPPLLKMANAPLLGPAMLAGAARAAGHSVEVVDLNAAWLRPYLAGCDWERNFIGDHDRPSARLAEVHDVFERLTGAGKVHGLNHSEVLQRADELMNSELAEFVRAQLPRELPRLVGVSVMYEGQVVAALVISRLVRDLCPTCVIVWGGAHVTALQAEIARDARYGVWVDRFVFGYAETTFVNMLDALSSGRALPEAAVEAGSGSAVRAEDDSRVTPHFDRVDEFGPRVALPAQASRGCAFGRCAFCTYPSIEGGYRPLELAPAMSVVDLAARTNVAVSFKDSLVTPDRLLTLARSIGGRVRWSACTKLHSRLTGAFMHELAAGGAHTLEFGVETLDPAAQRLIQKSQPAELLVQVLDAAMESGLAVVLNYITGFPGTAPGADERWLGFVRHSLEARPSVTAKLSVSQFELERQAPMARAPESYGIRVLRSWPWSSRLDWTTHERVSMTTRASAGNGIGERTEPRSLFAGP